ncbi:AraC family transcriptional regulator [Fulvivirgaceae bacterium PWU4]|uniref:AraC family transcriptional regulator n=1 Tax=Chryseosolibacter histidini TaxID=2782349 RepID=A0AAP2DQ76_9BACT|nr:AraC family transcriptional regulator [Chryseosolibacter histidini]MBT1700488.1 AraC family transcriptional regulator [Chryseosolibacter histidini]
MSSPALLQYQEILQQSYPLSGPEEAYGFKAWASDCESIGKYEERTLDLDTFSVREIRTTFERDCKIQVQHDALPGVVNVCMPIQGRVGTNFHEVGLLTELGAGAHHFIYIPETNYELVVHKNIRVAHFQVCTDYFSSLLCPSENWSDTLREKLLRKEMLYSGDGLRSPAIRQAIEAIINCPLSGTVRKLFLEAKVLELLALQLEHYQRGSNVQAVRINRRDKDVLEQLREHLLVTFHHDHSLQSLSTTFGINEFKLKKQFRELFGQTIFDFIFDLRMNHARHLLIDTGMFVNEVSREVGYRNPNHFSTAFRKKFGVCPGSLRS